MARYVTVGSVSMSPRVSFPGDPKGLLDYAAHMMLRAKHFGADIVAFPECFGHRVSEGERTELAEPLDGPTLTRVAGDAKRVGLYVVMPLYTREDGKVHNSAVLVSPAGEVTGVYHKMFPTIGEMENGITPGTEAPVFQTSFGKVGMAICFDMNFNEIMYGLGENGAEIVFFCSAYRGGLQLQIRAWELGAYIVSSVEGELGQIIDQSGMVLAESTYEALVTRRLNLDRRLLHMDGNWGKMDEMLAQYGPGVSFEYFTREACYTVASELEGVRVDEMLREFGLEERTAYFNRSRQRRLQALAG
jgi:predicted amidohydrolase